MKYNIAHTELLRRYTDEPEALGFDVAMEYQNEFRLKLEGATISGGRTWSRPGATRR